MDRIREFFRNDYPFIEFKPFDFIHITCIFFVVITLILIYVNRNKISALKETTKRKILITIAIIMLINMIIYNIAPHIFNYYDYKIHLPFQLCFISGYLFMYGIFFKNERILKITFFLSFIGPIPAILWPDLPSTFDDFNFWKYFISHHIFICTSFFSYYALNYKINKNNLLDVIIITQLMILAMMPFNIIFDMNYIYSAEIPSNIVQMYPFLKYIIPIFAIEFIGTLIFILVYQIVKIRNKELARQSI